MKITKLENGNYELTIDKSAFSKDQRKEIDRLITLPKKEFKKLGLDIEIILRRLCQDQ